MTLPYIIATQPTDIPGAYFDANYTFLENQGVQRVTATGAVNAYIASPAGALVSSYSNYKGTPFVVTFPVNNTGASTINFSGLGAVNLYKSGNNTSSLPLSANDIVAGVPYVVICDGSNFYILVTGATGDLSGITSINSGQIAGIRNKIINGDFRKWDYATSYNLTTTVDYGAANRFASNMASSAAGIFNRDTSVPAASSTTPGFLYSAKVGRNSGSALTNQINICQAIETVNSIPLAGKIVTLSFWAKSGANYSPTGGALSVVIGTGTGTDQSASSFVAGTWTGQSNVTNSATLTTSWARFQYTATIAAGSTQIGVQFGMVPTGSAGADDNFYITGIQLEVGPVATAFEDIGASLTNLFCARYLPHFNFPAGETLVAFGQAQSTSGIRVGVPFPAETRVAPTGVIVSAAGSFSIGRAAGSTACSSVTFPAGSSTKKIGSIDFALGSSPLSNDQCYSAVANTSAYIYFTGCEL